MKLANAFIRIDPNGFLCVYGKTDPPNTIVIWKAPHSGFSGHDGIKFCVCDIRRWLDKQKKKC